MTGTSVIAKAPFKVWIERCTASVTGCGALCEAASQASMVTRWPATSPSRISSSTGSTEAGTYGPWVRISGALSTGSSATATLATGAR